MVPDGGLSRLIGEPGALEVSGAPEGFDALVLADLVRARGGLTLFIARDASRASVFLDAFRFFAPDIPVWDFPAWDCLPYDRVGPTPGVSAQRMATLARLIQGPPVDQPVLLIATAAGAMQRIPPRQSVASAHYSAKVGGVVEMAQIERYFAVNGYQKASTVQERGEYAIRGGVIDVFPPGAESPVRLDLFGDTLESIRAFDPETQRSTRQLSSIDLPPVAEVLMDAASIARFRSGYLRQFGAPGDDPLYAAVSQGVRRAGMEHWLPLFHEGLESLFDLLPAEALVALDHLVDEALVERWDLIVDAYEAREAADRGAHYRALPPEGLYLEPQTWREALARRPSRRFSALLGAPSEGSIDLGARLGRSFAAERAQDSVNLLEAAAAHAKALAAGGKRVLFASWSDGASERLGAMLSDHGLKDVPLATSWSAALSAPKGRLQRAVLPLDQGFETSDLAFISETDILGDRLARPRRRRRAANFLAEASSLTPGDLVVHIDHGIGRYLGLKTLEVMEAPHDCLEILYAAESKLFLPVENIDLLTRYGSDEEGVALDRLGGAAWQARRARAKERLREMAEGLIAIAAARAMRSIEPTDPPAGLFDEFCARFPYEETDDQLNAISDILEDFGSGKPMDRLICGDVGFGKTEVALRAAFVMALSGRQVAVVCPTTLLARQHFATFTERFKGWPIRVRRLSRLAPAAEAAETRAGLAKGEIEVVVGTHALLSKSVSFKDLGLVIVDEEQHFGVKHKEALKALRAEVHMLTLTATPIPRTLQMALSGIREMSIIATPPVDRLAVRTYITPYDPVVVREA
ncbi:MAG: DEAD/DEAH box helicase, partial [Alphaproteobacteria bacterium]|nr:DEAD/DEAH box helicase [Alphaproteobacteria bacterium]